MMFGQAILVTASGLRRKCKNAAELLFSLISRYGAQEIPPPRRITHFTASALPRRLMTDMTKLYLHSLSEYEPAAF
jgi:hypothetical protein